jgi:hypothetical protein
MARDSHRPLQAAPAAGGGARGGQRASAQSKARGGISSVLASRAAAAGRGGSRTAAAASPPPHPQLAAAQLQDLELDMLLPAAGLHLPAGLLLAQGTGTHPRLSVPAPARAALLLSG